MPRRSYSSAMPVLAIRQAVSQLSLSAIACIPLTGFRMFPKPPLIPQTRAAVANGRSIYSSCLASIFPITGITNSLTGERTSSGIAPIAEPMPPSGPNAVPKTPFIKFSFIMPLTVAATPSYSSSTTNAFAVSNPSSTTSAPKSTKPPAILPIRSYHAISCPAHSYRP